MAKRKISRSYPLLGALARGSVTVAARLPIGRAQALGAALGRLCWLLPNRYRRDTLTNLEWCFPDLPARQRRRLARESLIETGKNIGESGAIWRWPAADLSRLIEGTEGEDLLAGALAERRGLLLLLPHLGNWEMLNPFLIERRSFAALYRPPRIAEMERALVEARQRTGCEMIAATPRGLRRLITALEEGKPILVLPDQEPLRRSGVWAPFFGVPALTMTLIARLLRRSPVPALFAWAERTSSGGFRVRFRDAPEGLDDPDPQRAAARLNLGVEACVRLCPEQYMWSYKRFKSRPPEEEAILRHGGDASRVHLYHPRRSLAAMVRTRRE